jgi:platelet-activating factor acetylhydrolase
MHQHHTIITSSHLVHKKKSDKRMIGLPQDFLATIATTTGSIDSTTAPAVGMRFFRATSEHPPIRLFYPATTTKNPQNEQPRPIRWFSNPDFLSFLSGYLHLSIARQDTKLFRWFVLPLVHCVSLFIPMRRLRIHGVFANAPPLLCDDKQQLKRPVIIFSHGLTGTGQENAVLCSAWAKQGFVVAAIHHTDGSSCYVQLADNTEKYYEHGPSMANYDRTFRPRQVQHRAREMLQTLQFLQSKDCPVDIREIIDTKRTVAAGFSFGAATVAQTLVTTMDTTLFCAALFLDGWFHIDVSESAGIEFHFPEEAFQKFSEKGIPVPSLFINSQQFQNYSKLFDATKRLAGADHSQVIVIPNTGHQNFCEGIFWIHSWLLKKVTGNALGRAKADEAYREIIQRSSDFMINAVKPTSVVDSQMRRD